MSRLDPILNFRTSQEISEHETETPMVTEGHTMITKSREAVDSSEHSDTEIL